MHIPSVVANFVHIYIARNNTDHVDTKRMVVAFLDAKSITADVHHKPSHNVR